MDEVIHLKTRTEFSFRETFAPLPRVVARLVELGYNAAGIVDLNGSTWGHVRWERALREAGISPVFGVELGISDDPARTTPAPTAWALARVPSALYSLASRAHLALAGGQPSVTRAEFLAAEGLIKFTGQAFRASPEAVEAGCIIDANPASPLATADALSLHRRTKGRLVITSDNAFAHPFDRKLFQLTGRSAKASPQHILGREEMEAAMEAHGFSKRSLLAARDTAEWVEGELKGISLPKAPIIKLEGDVMALCRAGQRARLDSGHIAEWTEEYEARLLREVTLVKEKAFDSYFIMVADLICWAKERMLVGPARGSSAGSLACYLMRITEVDPIPHGLLFERFVDITRTDLPDIDVDFPDAARDGVYAYLREKYGSEQVARLGTISEYKPRSALSEVARRLGIPPWKTQPVRDAMFVRSSADSRANNCLSDTLAETEPGRALVASFPAIVLAGEIEGHASHAGMHAAGVIVCNAPISNYCTVAGGVAQLDKIDAEVLNLLKIDALGLRTLSVIEGAGVLSRDAIYSLGFEDPAVFALLNEGRFSGIFQWEGQALQSLTSEIKISTFEDMVHITALARPGPLGGGAATHFRDRHAGREAIDVAHPSMLPYLEESYGLVLYQEQVIRIARDIGKLTWEDTTALRKAMSKSYGKEFFDAFGAKFAKGAATLGLKPETARDIWDQINSMGAWAFNKCAAGSTLVKIANTGGSLAGWERLDALHERYVENPSPWIRQQRMMPFVYSVFPDGRAYPQRVKAIHKNGVKPCRRFTFEDGSEVVCTVDHRFVINDRWRTAGEAKVGDGWLMAGLEPQEWVKRGSAATGGHWSTDKKGRRVSPSEQNRRTPIRDEFTEAKRGTGCEDCSKTRRRMEAHHDDFNEGRDRPSDLAWLCSGCHKRRHYAYDRTKRNEKGMRLAWKELISIADAGAVETYDLEMEEHHNYVINGGIVTHNSHAVSYAIVSYWTAYLKVHWPLEFAASSLRNAKDTDTALNMLREIRSEGIEYIPFSAELSEENWCVKDGKLIGGFLGIKGIGPSKAQEMLKARAGKGLTDKQRERLAAAELIFGELYPAQALWGEWYADNGTKLLERGTRVLRISDFPKDGGNVVFIGLLKRKDARDYNEVLMLAKRGGKVKPPPTAFLDLRVADDSTMSPLLCRVDRYDYEPTGRMLLERGREDQDWFLIRGEKLANFPMVQVHKIKCLNNKEFFKAERT